VLHATQLIGHRARLLYSTFIRTKFVLRDPRFSLLVEHRLVTDRQTDGRTDTWRQQVPR